MKTIVKVVTKTIIDLDYRDVHKLEQLIKEYYVHEYEIVPQEEWSNDSEHTIDVSKKEEMDEYDAGDIEDFKKSGDGGYMIHRLMQDMVNNDVIPAGEYVLNICW